MQDLEWNWKFRSEPASPEKFMKMAGFCRAVQCEGDQKMTHAIGISFGSYTGNLKLIDHHNIIQQENSMPKISRLLMAIVYGVSLEFYDLYTTKVALQ